MPIKFVARSSRDWPNNHQLASNPHSSRTLYILADNLPSSMLPYDELHLRHEFGGMASKCFPGKTRNQYQRHMLGIPTVNYDPNTPHYPRISQKDIDEAFKRIFEVLGTGMYDKIEIPKEMEGPYKGYYSFGTGIASNSFTPQEFAAFHGWINQNMKILENFCKNRDPNQLPAHFQAAFYAGQSKKGFPLLSPNHKLANTPTVPKKSDSSWEYNQTNPAWLQNYYTWKPYGGMTPRSAKMQAPPLASTVKTPAQVHSESEPTRPLLQERTKQFLRSNEPRERESVNNTPLNVTTTPATPARNVLTQLVEKWQEIPGISAVQDDMLKLQNQVTVQVKENNREGDSQKQDLVYTGPNLKHVCQMFRESIPVIGNPICIIDNCNDAKTAFKVLELLYKDQPGLQKAKVQFPNLPIEVLQQKAMQNQRDPRYAELITQYMQDQNDLQASQNLKRTPRNN